MQNEAIATDGLGPSAPATATVVPVRSGRAVTARCAGVVQVVSAFRVRLYVRTGGDRARVKSSQVKCIYSFTRVLISFSPHTYSLGGDHVAP